MNKDTVTGRIYIDIFRLLEENPEGIRWTDLNKALEAADSSRHPKTVNGCVWKLIEKYPDEVYKPSKGVFKLTKYK